MDNNDVMSKGIPGRALYKQPISEVNQIGRRLQGKKREEPKEEKTPEQR